MELKQYAPLSLMFKISIREISSVVTIKADEFDSVWMVVGQVVKKCHARLSDFTPSLYALFTEDGLEMDENDLLQKFKDKQVCVVVFLTLCEQNCVFKRKDNASETLDLKVTVATDELITTMFDSRATVQQCVKRFVKQHFLKSQPVLQNAYEYGFRLSPVDGEEIGTWMDDMKPIGSFNLTETVTLSSCGITCMIERHRVSETSEGFHY